MTVDLSEIFTIDPEVGYLGLLLVSFFGSLIPFVPFPAFLLLAAMSIGNQFDPHALAIISAVMAAAAKQIIFYASYGGRKIITEKTRKRIKPFERLVKRYGAAAAFIAAATPIPDDLIYIPLGLAKYNPLRFFISTLAGKIVLGYTIVYVSRGFGLSFIDPLLGRVQDMNEIYIGTAIFIAITTGIVVLMLRLNWEKILGRIAPWALNPEKDENS
ncbi:MAG TPA: VTT domain-containing protein [Nitrosopumilaceae archaeon]|nr:VTT domain-containing protein [Nitrosopumilaceae archaeon]